MPKICNLAAVAVLALAIVSPAQIFTTFVAFDGPDGAEPYFAPLVQGLDGNLYGTTSVGGATGYGTVVRITPNGTLTTLYDFCRQANCVDGWYPVAGLALATGGDLYGTTLRGGSHGNGTIFKITPGGTFTTLYSFCAQSACGANPVGVLVQAENGNFYGTAESGGANNKGTVFKMTPSGTVTTVHSFAGADGAYPIAGLIQATAGEFYGTTYAGGSSYCKSGCGMVFKISASGKLTRVYKFGGTDGAYPFAGLMQATDGNLYGATMKGGAYRLGTVFKVTPGGTLTTLHSFCPHTDCSDGSLPEAGLLEGSDGNLYGTTVRGGANLQGTIFKITPGGSTLTTLYSFCGQTNCADGYNALAALMQATGGNLYGTTRFGGGNCINMGGCGTVFSLGVGLGPFVEALPYSGKIGTTTKLLGQGLKGTTAVSFNGTAANFIVKSDTYLTAVVPTGATSGFVTVTTSAGVLTSNKQFRVRP
jgi:uncharacterized repeat protein (TIGR03803 family)